MLRRGECFPKRIDVIEGKIVRVLYLVALLTHLERAELLHRQGGMRIP